MELAEGFEDKELIALAKGRLETYHLIVKDLEELAKKEQESTDVCNLHGVNDLLVDFQHYLVLDGALDIDEDEIKRNAEVYSTNRR